jgi:hypothetical protein
MPSTSDISTLAGIDRLRRLCQSLALLDAIWSPLGYREHQFCALWRPNQSLASWDNFCGDNYFIRFDNAGAIIKGHAHESAVWASIVDSGQPFPGVLEDIPEEFSDFHPEPVWAIERFGGFTTFCTWRRYNDLVWQVGPVDIPPRASFDGSSDLLHLLDGDAVRYRAWAEDYYDRPVPQWAVDHIYAHVPICEEVITSLNPQASPTELVQDVSSIGYPM